MEFEDLDNPRKSNPWRDCDTAAAIGPKGEFVYRHFSKTDPELRDAGIGNVPIRSFMGRAIISRDFERAGWVLYEDLCKGKVEGVEADMAKWAVWQRLISERAKGTRIQSRSVDDKVYLHAEVLRRREMGGIHSATDDQVKQWAIEAGIPVDADLDLAAEVKKGKK